ncbi:HNH endonuclease signature motif containing protein [Rhodococcoides yunnanense]|uniref:HNH endonuclease signature motif containing protein n=1 Tax=Rhodococcoides yunnanense TaxID=278209 RepID=UPI000A93632E|nr:HNH endonuclease signature motif containing protein [Rhodococcus yunnanensis]
MLSGESVAGLVDDMGVGSRGVLPISDPSLCDAVESMEAAWAAVADVETWALTDADRRAVLVRMETLSRAMYGTSHTWLTELIEGDGLAVLPERANPSRLACLLRIDPGVAGKRIKIAAKMSARRAMTGERLEPVFPTTAQAHRAGEIDAAHVSVVEEFFKELPEAIDHDSKVQSEMLLGTLAKELSPEQLRVAAARLHALLDPDGELDDDTDLSRKCYFHLGQQGKDGLSKGGFVIDAEFRAYLEALLAKLARPGQCNPDEPKPVADEPGSSDGGGTGGSGTGGGGTGGTGGGDSGGGGGPSGTGGSGSSDPTLFGPEDTAPEDPAPEDTGPEDPAPENTGPGDTGPEDAAAARDRVTTEDERRRAGRDIRTQGQRNHDAMKAVLRQMLASGSLGRHRGLPVTAVISMTAADLESASGHAVTGTGSLVSMRDAIRMASHAHQFLAVFDDDGRALYLGRSKRIASADQRIVLIARDRGCSFPACTRPATWSQVHHIAEWDKGGDTDIDSLTFGCDRHHPLVGDGPNDWATTTAGPNHPQAGRTLWHPPEAVDPTRRGMVNHYHHPQEFLYREPEDPGPGRPGPGKPGPGSPGTGRPGTRKPEPGKPEPGTPGHGEPEP